jgi:ribosomal protein S18 acetylase RimI-like enzyme
LPSRWYGAIIVGVVTRALLAHAEHYAASEGAGDLRIGVLSDNTPALTLYLEFGFRPYLETLSKSPARQVGEP